MLKINYRVCGTEGGTCLHGKHTKTINKHETSNICGK